MFEAIQRLWREKPVKRLAILDDFFPNPMSGFRFEEYVSYLDAMPEAYVYTDGMALGLIPPIRPIEQHFAEHIAAYPRHAGRMEVYAPEDFPDADAYYTIFLNTIIRHLPGIERAGKPFAFTLYPGGGFHMEEALSDSKLDALCNSPMLHGIITTQAITRDYLVRKWPQVESRLIPVFGGTIPRIALEPPKQREFYGAGKAYLDMAFVAHRYTENGADKGYDLFIDTARHLVSQGIKARYHIVGPWDAEIIPLGDLAPHCIFHGSVSTERLRELGQGFDLILSANRPSISYSGSFDGFPTGSCVEVGLQQAVIMCSDVLGLNRDFDDGRNIVLVDPSLDSILAQLMPLIAQPGELAQIGRTGAVHLRELFSRERQMGPRLKLLRGML